MTIPISNGSASSVYVRQVIRRHAELNRADHRDTNLVIDHLQTEIAVLTVVNRALIDLLTAKGLVTHAEIEAQVKAVADQEWSGTHVASPEDLAKDLHLKTESDEKRAADAAERESIAQARIDAFRSHPGRM